MQVIDLTMRITPSIRVFPGSPQPSFIPWSRFEIHGYDSEVMFMSTHTGTHIDAPCHFKPGLATIDMISAKRLVCNAILIRAERTANQLIEQQDLGNEIRQGDAVVIATGWEKKYSSKRSYMTENPGLSEQAAKYLVRKKVNAVAIDCPSIDAGAETKFVAHNILLENNILVVENLCNLDNVAKKIRRSNNSNIKKSITSATSATATTTTTSTFTLIISPLKLGGATGSPARVFALL